MPRQTTLDFDTPPPGSWEERIRRVYLEDGEPAPDWLVPLLATIRLQEAELQKLDPLSVRVPVVGDLVEVCGKRFHQLGWTPATVVGVDYPRGPFMDVRLEARRETETLYFSRQAWNWNPNIEKGPLWRWPQKEGDR